MNRKPVKRVIKVKVTQKPVRMGSGGLVSSNGLRSVVRNGKRVFYT